MGKSSQVNNTVLLLDNYNEESALLHESLKQAGFKGRTLVIEDEGFFPEDVISIYQYFCGEYKKNVNVPLKPRYFNQINKPDYWEITASNNLGKITNKAKEKGRIFYAEPRHRRLVRVVDWYNDEGKVRVCDHYNRHGALYAKTFFNKDGKKFCKTYYDGDGKEIITDNYVTNDIILNRDGKVFIYRNKVDLILKVIEELNANNCRIIFNSLSTPFFVSNAMKNDCKEDILFWQEKERNDIPGNMQGIFNNPYSRVKNIFVQKRKSYEKLIELGAPKDIVKPLGLAYQFEKENTYSNEALICTNSDQIEKLTEIVESLPEVHFNITAITEMSSKLMSMSSYKNVTLYPGARIKTINELFDKCDIYLDINYGDEIVSSVKNAFLHNEVILGLKNLIHDDRFVADEHIFDDHQKMVDFVKKLLENIEVYKESIAKQRYHAMSEDAATYTGLLSWEG